jgi:hypothetical protein
LLLATASLAAAQTTTVPPTIPVPQPGSNVIAGQWDPQCAGNPVTVTDANGNVIGTGVIQPDGSFIVYLNRPLRAGETVTISSPCGPNSLLTTLGPSPFRRRARCCCWGPDWRAWWATLACAGGCAGRP